MRHALDQLLSAFGPPGPDHPLRAVGCWDPHTWNPTSDHPRGRACDLFPTRAGTFPTGTDLTNGWRIATWLRAHATALHIRYVIWQDRYWSPTTADDPGSWGIRYDGGGIYDPHDATGGHYDHVHVSVASEGRSANGVPAFAIQPLPRSEYGRKCGSGCRRRSSTTLELRLHAGQAQLAGFVGSYC